MKAARGKRDVVNGGPTRTRKAYEEKRDRIRMEDPVPDPPSPTGRRRRRSSYLSDGYQKHEPEQDQEPSHPRSPSRSLASFPLPLRRKSLDNEREMSGMERVRWLGATGFLRGQLNNGEVTQRSRTFSQNPRGSQRSAAPIDVVRPFPGNGRRPAV